MIPLECVSSIKWTAQYALKLRALRGKDPRHKILSQLALSDLALSPEGLRLLEDGIAATIAPNLLIGLCNIYGVHPGEIIWCIKIGLPERG